MCYRVAMNNDELISFVQKRVNLRLLDGRTECGILRILDDDSSGERAFYLDPSGPKIVGFYQPVRFLAREVDTIHLA